MRERILKEALPGTDIAKVLKKWRALPDQPWKFWESRGEKWAVFQTVGERIANVTVGSIRKCSSLGLKPVVVAVEKEELGAIAHHYLGLNCHLACEISGRGTLVPPPQGLVMGRSQKTQQVRMPRFVLRELSRSAVFPQPLRRAVRQAYRAHARLTKKNNDEAEQDLLRAFGQTVMRAMGFRSGALRAADVLRRIEIAHWNGNRDHFFHSFQNYFIGLIAVSQLVQVFEDCQVITDLNWRVDPHSVWFLTALYHDVGYATQRFQDITADIWGMGDSGGVVSYTISQFLADPKTQLALREISSLIYRLLCLRQPASTWTPPTLSTRRSPEEHCVENALADTVGEGHGPASALLLHRDLMPLINRMGVAKRDLLRQTVWMACCSMPFHDWRFRRALRLRLGSCQVPTNAMPYAATLAFVDSIQEDCRDLSGIKTGIRFLEKLVVDAGPRVSARVNMKALGEEDVLWKIVEARDVLAALRVPANAPSFDYPAWMVA